MKRVCSLLLLLFLFLSAQAQNRFESEIRAFEQLDAQEKSATGQILLYGSSSMRLWDTYAEDLAGYRVINRGFGGSEMSDAIYFFDRVVLPLRPSLILLYEGDNDISNGKKTPKQIVEDFKTFMALVEEKLPDTKVAVYSLRPSVAREKTMPEQRKVNAAFKKYCRKHPKKAFYIDIYKTLLTESGLPNPDYLIGDMLHLNNKGYELWTKATRDFLEQHIGPATFVAPTLQLLPQNPHYFQYQGKPTVIVGSGEHYGAVMNLDFDYDTYLETLQKDGLNTTRLFMGAYYEQPGAFGIQHNTMAPAADKLVLPWNKKEDKYDLNSWNDTYFNRLHDFMQKAAQRGVLVEITLFSAYYGAGWAYHPFNGANNINGTPADLSPNQVNTLNNGTLLGFQEAYTRKLVAELNRYDHFYVEIQNEPWAEGKDTVLVWNDYLGPDDLKQSWLQWKNTLEIASEASRNWHKTVSGWIADTEKMRGKKHLISHNIANFKLPVWVSDPRISIYTFHYASPEAATMNYGLNKVIGFNETGFAGKSDETYRRQAWRFMMSGGGLFNHLDYSFTVGHEKGTELANEAPGGGSPSLRKYFKVLKNYLEGLDLATLQPDHAFLQHVEGAFSYAMRDAEHWVVYIEPILTKPAGIQLTLPKGNYTATWTDVQTGNVMLKEPVTITEAVHTVQSPAGANDKVLKMRKM